MNENDRDVSLVSPVQDKDLTEERPGLTDQKTSGIKIKKSLPFPLIILLLTTIFIAGLSFSAWYFQIQLAKLNKQTQTMSAANTQIPRHIIIGIDATDPPMEEVASGGALMGYDIDLGNSIANELGARVEFRNIPRSNIFQALQEKKIDMIISSIIITDQQEKAYDFSEPYMNAGQVIVSRKDHIITAPDQLSGKKIAVQQGTASEQEAMKLTPPNLVMSNADFVAAARMLSTGKTDVLLADLPLAKGLVNQFNNLSVTSDPFTNEYYGIVFRKDEQNVLKRVNNAFAILRVNGTLTDLKQKWLE